MSTLNKEKFEIYKKVEEATIPLDDISTLLFHAVDSFNLDSLELDDYEKFDLLNNYRTLGSILLTAIREINHVNEDVKKIIETKDSDDQDQVIG